MHRAPARCLGFLDPILGSYQNSWTYFALTRCWIFDTCFAIGNTIPINYMYENRVTTKGSLRYFFEDTHHLRVPQFLKYDFEQIQVNYCNSPFIYWTTNGFKALCILFGKLGVVVEINCTPFRNRELLLELWCRWTQSFVMFQNGEGSRAMILVSTKRSVPEPFDAFFALP